MQWIITIQEVHPDTLVRNQREAARTEGEQDVAEKLARRMAGSLLRQHPGRLFSWELRAPSAKEMW